VRFSKERRQARYSDRHRFSIADAGDQGGFAGRKESARGGMATSFGAREPAPWDRLRKASRFSGVSSPQKCGRQRGFASHRFTGIDAICLRASSTAMDLVSVRHLRPFARSCTRVRPGRGARSASRRCWTIGDHPRPCAMTGIAAILAVWKTIPSPLGRRRIAGFRSASSSTSRHDFRFRVTDPGIVHQNFEPPFGGQRHGSMSAWTSSAFVNVPP